MENKAKMICFGTPEFAVPTLKALHQEGYNIVLVVTQPDKPVGRKGILTPSPVKVLTKELGLEVCQRFDNLKLKTKSLKPDLGVVVAYGEIIPKDILDLFPLGILNIHPSLLPKYRGPSPIQATILNGDKETGVSIIKLDEKMDHGAKLKTQNLKLKTDDIYVSLSQRLAMAGAQLLIDILPDYLVGKIKPVPQDDARATFTKIITKEDGRINWQKSAEEIERQIRAYAPWPGCFSEFVVNGKKINVKIIEAIHELPLQDDNQTNIGQFSIQNGQLFVQCGHGALLIEKIQPEGKKEMTAKEFINGYLK